MKLRPDQLPPGVHRDKIEAALAAGERQLEKNLSDNEALGRRRKIKNRPEEDLQKELISTAATWHMRLLINNTWPKLIYKSVLLDWLYHIPNGGHRSMVEAKIFKAMGVKAGVSDLFLMVPTNQFAGLYLELKADNNAMTDNQQKFFERAITIGYQCYEIRTGLEFNQAIEGYFMGARPHCST